VAERTGLSAFDLDALPETVDIRQGGNTIRAYPSLVDEGASVAIRILGTAAEQAREHPRGIRRLLAIATPNPMSYVQGHLTGAEKLAIASSPYPSTAALLDDALSAAIAAAAGDRAPFTRAAFEALRDEVAGGVLDAVFRVVSDAATALTAARQADKAISSASSLALMAPLADARAQLAALVFPGFIAATGAEQLRRLPVYVQGIAHRAARVAENVGRDRVWQTEVEQATALYRDAGGPLPITVDTPARLREVRWMLEELRISLFAQQLGAVGPISVQRVRKALTG
jgi:ATP-dependent helicase HrpA